MTNKWMQKLGKMDGALDRDYNFYAPENVIHSLSPSINWIFGKGNGLPYGMGVLLYGKPKSGKSLVSEIMAGGVHAANPDAMVVKFDTEYREDNSSRALWNIDDSRYQAYNTNKPVEIFDRINDEFVPMLEEGMPLKLIIIDSVKGIEGVKEGDADKSTDHLMGDHALTIGKGLKRILPIIRKYKIALICCEHVRANLNAGTYGPKEHAAGGWAEKHFFEYYVEVKRAGGAENNKSMAGESFEGDIKATEKKKELLARKVIVKMADNTKSINGREALITLHRLNGLVNVEDEVFTLGWRYGIITKEGARSYVIGNQKFDGKPKVLQTLKENVEMQQFIIKSISEKDVAMI